MKRLIPWLWLAVIFTSACTGGPQSDGAASPRRQRPKRPVQDLPTHCPHGTKAVQKVRSVIS